MRTVMKGARQTSYVIRIGVLILVLALTQLVQAAGSGQWTQLSPTGGPPAARAGHTAVYDPASNRMIVFGSSGGGNVGNDVWVLTNADGLGGTPVWAQLTPSGGPPPARTAHSAVYDPGTNSMIVYSGYLTPGGCFGNVNDVWVLSGANGLGTPTWTQLSPSGTAPLSRRNHSAVYNASNNRMIVYSGDLTDCPFGTPPNDVWVLVNANGSGTPSWTQLAPSGGPPNPRYRHTAVYDPGTNRMIVFGGLGFSPCCTALNDVWVLSNANGLGGTPTWTQLSPSGTPPSPRVFHTAVYDQATNSMVIFAGQGAVCDGTNDAWVLTNANGLGGTPTWSQLTPSGGPPLGRYATSAVYHQTSGRMTIFGGLNGCASPLPLNDTWVLSNFLTIPFTAFSAKVDITLASSAFTVNSTFTLGTGGSIAPLTQPVTIQLGTASITIPAGSFHLAGHGKRFVFSGVINGVAVDANLTPLGGSSYSLKVDAAGVSNLPSSNPVTVGLTIGDNTGSLSVTASIQ